MISNLYDNAGFESCILLGDFNHPEIDWTNESCACHTEHPASTFLETVRDNFVTQAVDQPTHYRSLQKANILDLIFSNG